MAANTNMHVTRDQAVTMLGAVLLKKRLLREYPHWFTDDKTGDLRDLASAESMLNAALDRIRDLEDRRRVDRRPIREKLVAVNQPSLKRVW